jgi:BirA family biotin operon repressor/biotin-[acetyl-CoA-carboxylase] ligase
MSNTIEWPTDKIREAIAPGLPGFRVEVLPQVDSTNSELMRRARNGQMEPVLLVAEQQTAGRGRLGRLWFSGQSTSGMASTAAPDRPGQDCACAMRSATHGVGRVWKTSSLTFSLGLALSPLNWSGLSLAVGVSVVQSLHPDLRLKWPNDVWWHGRKLAGILIETASFGATRYAVIGVGINIDRPESTGFATPPAWLRELLPDTDAPRTLLQIATPVLQTVKAFERHGFAPFQAVFNERDALHGLDIILSDGTFGVALGANAVGALQVQTALGLTSLTSAEVSVRPLSNPSFDRT